jgi:hypothetical protein
MLVEKITSKIDELEKIILALTAKLQENSSPWKELIHLGATLKILEVNIKPSDAYIKFHEIDENLKSIDMHLRNLSKLLRKKEYISLLTKIEVIKINLIFKKLIFNLLNFISF